MRAEINYLTPKSISYISMEDLCKNHIYFWFSFYLKDLCYISKLKHSFRVFLIIPVKMITLRAPRNEGWCCCQTLSRVLKLNKTYNHKNTD